uniref:DNA methyltransferase n=1 Tax=Trichocoleus desertorum TaxID=1481672 RepID=UPI0025B2846C|nr:DNA methyltransferase [Trichocoleus desertorum]
MTFKNDEARRAYFLEKLREKLKDPEFRAIEGFPIGEDEDILALSDPPYYTACPNPFLEGFIRYYGKPYDPETSNYHREPLAADISEGKTDSLYTAHGYHTKVPHKAIMRYILHYTEPGDIVLDGFSGSGLTGVAAQMCGSPDPGFKTEIETEREVANLPPVQWGLRRAVLNDISIAATFMGANYNLPFDVEAFEHEAKRILKELKDEIGWMYETLHTDGKTKCRINYTVWSDVFSCPECTRDVTFLTEALDLETKRVKNAFPCSNCGAELTKKRMDRLYETYFDSALGRNVRRIKRKPVLINYVLGKRKLEKQPDEKDLEIFQRIENQTLPISVPTVEIPFMHMTHQRARMEAFGITHIHHFFLSRAAKSLSILWQKVSSVENLRTRNMLLFFAEQAIWGMSLLNRYSPLHFSQVNRYLNGVYYVGSQTSECSPWYILDGKLTRLVQAFKSFHANTSHITANASITANLDIPDNSIDYIFTDPPFGENIYYADLNFLIESWHKVRTNADTEAIIDKAKQKDLSDYQQLMQRCFEQYYRVLKPGRWMTMVFHNSKNAVWNVIQEAMLSAGFVVSTVRTLNKQQGSYRQVTSSAPKEDLVVSAYKPNGGLESRFKLEAGTKEGVWDFVRTHLGQLPVMPILNDCAEPVSERTSQMLYDQMVAFHVQRGVMIPLSAAEFYAGMEQRFEPRNGMYFLPEQALEYDRKRHTVREFLQLELLVTDEESAIQWVRQQLTRKPQTLQELTPKFMKEGQRSWAKHERLFELRELLEDNFPCYKGNEPIPPQIVSWLKESSIYRQIIDGMEADHLTNTGLESQNAVLLNAAFERWYVPNPARARDLELIRDQKLLREFEQYRQSNQRKLKPFRTEAIRAGFKQCWQERTEEGYRTILDIAHKIPETILQEDPKLFRFYNQAVTRLGGL